MKELLKKYSHAWTLLYVLLYMPWFMYLEKTVTTNYHVMYMKLDDIIPFCEWFIIPYFIWFLFVPVVFGYLFFFNKKEYYRSCAYMFSGMTIFLIICTIYPNGQELRPVFDADKNICTKIVSFLYSTDTSTNVFPSMHAFNTIACLVAVLKEKTLRKKKWVTISTTILSVLICMATVFLKQHSFLDVIGSVVLALVLYPLVYWLPQKLSKANKPSAI